MLKDGTLQMVRADADVEATAVQDIEVARRYCLSWRQTRAMQRRAPRKALHAALEGTHCPHAHDRGRRTDGCGGVLGQKGRGGGAAPPHSIHCTPPPGMLHFTT